MIISPRAARRDSFSATPYPLGFWRITLAPSDSAIFGVPSVLLSVMTNSSGYAPSTPLNSFITLDIDSASFIVAMQIEIVGFFFLGKSKHLFHLEQNFIYVYHITLLNCLHRSN